MLPAPAIDLCERQHGVIARYQLLRWIDTDRLETLMALHYLENLERGVYRVVGGSPVGDQAPFAAALRARPATITGPYVLAHLGVDGFDRAAPFEILTRPDRSLSNVRFPHRPDPLPDRPTIRIGDVRLAAPMDALIDTGRFAGEVTNRQLRLAYDHLRWNDKIDRDRFDAHLERRLADTDPGAVALEAALGIADRRADSEGERHLGSTLTSFRPAPEPQVWVTPARRVDWYLRSLLLAFEYHGSVDHDHVDARAADSRRDAELVAAGIRVEHLRYADLWPAADLLARLSAIITLRAKELGVTAPVFVG